jgi:hypothetical protein
MTPQVQVFAIFALIAIAVVVSVNFGSRRR